jgi:hypothetical protein
MADLTDAERTEILEYRRGLRDAEAKRIEANKYKHHKTLLGHRPDFIHRPDLEAFLESAADAGRAGRAAREAGLIAALNAARAAEGAEGATAAEPAEAVSAEAAPDEPTKTSSDLWLKVPQVAKYLGMSEKAVRNNAAKGNIPASKMPKNSNRGTWMFKKDDIDSYLKKAPKKRKIKDLEL